MSPYLQEWWRCWGALWPLSRSEQSAGFGLVLVYPGTSSLCSDSQRTGSQTGKHLPEWHQHIGAGCRIIMTKDPLKLRLTAIFRASVACSWLCRAISLTGQSSHWPRTSTWTTLVEKVTFENNKLTHILWCPKVSPTTLRPSVPQMIWIKVYMFWYFQKFPSHQPFFNSVASDNKFKCPGLLTLKLACTYSLSITETICQ